MKKIIITIIATLAFSTSALALSFSDVNESETYYNGINYLSQEGIVNGNPDGTYKPNNTLNRAEMIKIIAEGAAKYYGWKSTVFDSYADKNCFPDIKANQWYTKYVCYGADKGWVKGYTDGKYKPDQAVSFVEGLKITFKGFAIPYDESDNPWYKSSVEYASGKNYIPFTINSFSNGLKRNEMADMVSRIIKAGAGEGKLNEYLGNRADIVVTYETIKDGLNLSTMQSQTINAN